MQEAAQKHKRNSKIYTHKNTHENKKTMHASRNEYDEIKRNTSMRESSVQY